MSSIIYNKAFEVELSHEFYVYTMPDSPVGNEFKINQFLEIIPTVECSDLMSKGRMRFIRTGKGLVVFYKSYLDSAPFVPVEKPLVKLSGAQEFLFVVRLQKDAMQFIPNVTDLDVNSQTYGSGKVLLLDGNVSAYPAPPPPYLDTLSPSLIDQLRPSVFTYTFLPITPTLTANLIVKVYPENSLIAVITVNPVLADPSTGIYSVQIDLSNQPKGIYTIEAKNGATLENAAIIYVDNNLARESVFGLIRIKYSNVATLLYETCTDKKKFFTFDYDFVARSVTWRYYIAAQNLGEDFFDTNNLAVINENASPVVFEASNPGPDGQPYGEPDDKIKINGFETVILTSTAPIPFNERARLNMNLFKHIIGGGDTRIVSNLPNANPNGVDTDQLGAAQVPPTITNDIAEIFVIV